MYKAGIWGNGFVAHSHAAALNALGIEIVAVCGKDNARTEAFAKQYGIVNYGIDPKIILKNDEIDVVHITTPPTMHTDMVKRSLNSKKHVVCEKPLCLEDKDTIALQKCAMENDRRVVVNFNIRCHQAIDQIHHFIGIGELGQLRMVHGSYMQEFHVLPANLDWRYDEHTAGKMRAISEQGSHMIDMLMYLTGESIVSVSAHTYNAHPLRKLRDGVMYPDGEGRDITVSSEDVAYLNVRLESGIVCNFVLSEISPGRNNRFTIELSGDKAGIWWDSENFNRFHIGRKGEGVQSYVNGFAGGFNDTFIAHFRNAYRYLKTGEKAGVATLEDAMMNVRTLNAAFRSSEQGGAVIKVMQLD